MPKPPRSVAIDASVLINLIHANRLDLLASLPGLVFAVPDHVEEGEITRPEQTQALRDAAERGFVRRESSTDAAEVQLYEELRRKRIGRGEAACLAMAIQRGWIVASDDRGRFLRIARERVEEGRLLNTPGLLLLAVKHDVISVHEADGIKSKLEQRRFRMRFSSFGELFQECHHGDEAAGVE